MERFLCHLRGCLKANQHADRGTANDVLASGRSPTGTGRRWGFCFGRDRGRVKAGKEKKKKKKKEKKERRQKRKGGKKKRQAHHFRSRFSLQDAMWRSYQVVVDTTAEGLDPTRGWLKEHPASLEMALLPIPRLWGNILPRCRLGLGLFELHVPSSQEEKG